MKIVKHYIQGQAVPESSFQAFLEGLTETGGWFCHDCNVGGETGFDAIDQESRMYEYRAVERNNLIIYSITRK